MRRGRRKERGFVSKSDVMDIAKTWNRGDATGRLATVVLRGAQPRHFGQETFSSPASPHRSSAGVLKHTSR